MATSVPAAPMAMPSVAVAMAGASLTPSPTIPTPAERATSARTASTFSWGSSPAFTSSAPSSAATARTASGWSPDRTEIPRTLSPLTSRTRSDAERRGGHGRRVVDPIADHPDPGGAGHERAHRLDLLVGEQPGLHLVRAELGGHGAHGIRMVARQDRDPADPLVLQVTHRGGRVGPERVAEGEGAEHRALGAHVDDRPGPGGLPGRPAEEQRVRLGAHALGHLQVAGPDVLPFDPAMHAFAREGGEVLDVRDLESSLESGFHGGAGEVVLGRAFQRGGEGEEPVAGHGLATVPPPPAPARGD